MPVLMFSPNGAITTTPTIQEAVALGGAMLVVVTSNQTITGTLTIPIGMSFSVTNGAVITVNSGATLNIYGEFKAPHQNTWVNVLPGGTVDVLTTGSDKQSFVCNNLVATGGLLCDGNIQSYTDIVALGRFIGSLNGNADTATSASSASNAAGTGTIPTAFGGATGTKLVFGSVTGGATVLGGAGFTASVYLAQPGYVLISLTSAWANAFFSVVASVEGDGLYGFCGVVRLTNQAFALRILNSAGVLQPSWAANFIVFGQ